MNHKIGEAAGVVWKALDVGGPMSMAELTRKSKLPAALLQRALGWLAREDRIRLTHDKTKEVIALHR